MEKPDGTGGVDVDVLEEIAGLHLGNFDEGGRLEDAGIGNHDVEVCDTLRSDGFDGFEGVGFRGALDLDNDDFAALGCGNLGQRLGFRGVWAANSGDDNGVGTAEVLLDEAAADALGSTADEDIGCHDKGSPNCWEDGGKWAKSGADVFNVNGDMRET